MKACASRPHKVMCMVSSHLISEAHQEGNHCYSVPNTSSIGVARGSAIAGTVKRVQFKPDDFPEPCYAPVDSAHR